MPENHAKSWSPDTAYIIERLALWHTAEEIGRFLGRTRRSVLKFCSKHDLPIHWKRGRPRTWSDSKLWRAEPCGRGRGLDRKWNDRERYVILALADKTTVSDAARMLHRSRHSLYHQLRKTGVCYGQGFYTATFVAKLCACSITYVGVVAKRLGIKRVGGGTGRYRLKAGQVRELVAVIRPGRLDRCPAD